MRSGAALLAVSGILWSLTGFAQSTTIEPSSTQQINPVVATASIVPHTSPPSAPRRHV